MWQWDRSVKPQCGGDEKLNRCRPSSPSLARRKVRGPPQKQAFKPALSHRFVMFLGNVHSGKFKLDDPVTSRLTELKAAMVCGTASSRRVPAYT